MAAKEHAERLIRIGKLKKELEKQRRKRWSKTGFVSMSSTLPAQGRQRLLHRQHMAIDKTDGSAKSKKG